jgi:hypothetical protein
MAMTKTILIRPDGRIEYCGDDGAGLAAGKVTKRRASHVVPVAPWRRLAFLALRAVCSDESRLSAWTRTWRGPWRVEILGGPVGGPFAERARAIEWELNWLRRNRT